MSEIITTKKLNLYQLGQEIGGERSFRLVGPDGEGQYRLDAPGVGVDRLTAAVEAHQADPSITPPLTADEQAAATQQANRTVIEDAVRAHMADLNTIIGSSGTLTGAQLSNAVRVLARGQKRLIRLAIGDLDATD